MMRALVIVVALAALGWSGYWLIGARATEGAVRDWLSAREAEGWVAEYESLRTRGFPNRFDTTIEGLELADPETGWSWRAPVFQVLALSYRPRHVIAIWPETQSFASPFETVTVTGADIRGSLVFGPGAELPLERATVTLQGVALSSDAEWQAGLAEGQLAVRRAGEVGAAYDLAFEARDLVLPGRLRERASRSGMVGEAVDLLKLDAQIAVDAPLDRRAVEVARPQPVRIALPLAQASWGELDLRAAGALDVDAAGRPEGEITVKAENWREILVLAREAGLVPEAAAPLIERGLETLAGFSGSRTGLDVPLRFRDGRVSLGGLIPLGPAPVLRLR